MQVIARIISCGFAALLSLNISSCTKNLAVEGKIVYGAQGVYVLDLHDESTEALYSSSKIYTLYVDNVDENLYLISTFSHPPGANRHKISLLDTHTGNVDFLRNGTRASFYGGVNKFVFFDEERRLLASSLEQPERHDIIDETAPLDPALPVKISDHSFLFSSSRNGEYGVYLYNLKSGFEKEVRAYKSCSLHRAVWRTATRQLLCQRRESSGQPLRKFQLVSADGQTESISFGDSTALPVAYLEPSDALLYQQQAGWVFAGERTSVGIYSFDDRVSRIMIRDLVLSRGVHYEHQ